ncbi:hypothetical protein ASG29_11840 [Sphingomonas sp. Leaf412]|nr:hypothetical protein ASG29_11840 [Sphingomonas sp. Leaf412]
MSLTACGPASVAPGNAAEAAASPTPTPTTTPTPALALALTPIRAADCEPDAPQSPCPIVGHWRIAKVYVPGAGNPLADDRAMVGATLTVTPNGAGPGALRWDGPDTGQFDIRDVCTGPFLSAQGVPAGDVAARRTLAAALAAWGVPADAAAARMLECDQGQWAVPDTTGGHGLVLPMGARVAIQWYEGRFLLLERRALGV